MTATDETQVLDDELLKSAQESTEETGDDSGGADSGEETVTEKKKRDRDFSKVRKLHTDLAAYVNEHSGLDPVSANQVKAILYLRPDFNNTPEQESERAVRAQKKAAEDARYAGLTDEQKKARKAADRATATAEKMAARAKQAQDDADRLLAQANSGEDIAGQVEAQQESVPDPNPDPLTATPEETSHSGGRRGIGRRNR